LAEVRVKRRILTEDSYTFSKYSDLPYRTADILADLGCSFERSQSPLQLPTRPGLYPLESLKATLARNQRRIIAVTETAKREAIVAPILVEVCEAVDALLDIEYPISVNAYLKGTLDYFVSKKSTLLVVEAKQADLDRGFTQLAVELIALDQWIESSEPVLYGAVTTGESWRFGTYDRAAKQIMQDSILYTIPDRLEDLMNSLTGILLLNDA
jgi:hypothetical protein